MEDKIADSILTVCRILNKHDVQYMIVGGIAVALHGYFRQSHSIFGLFTDKPDLDFWYNPTYENYYKLLNALAELGQDVTEFVQEQAPNPKKSFFKFELEAFTLDLLPTIKAPLNFSSSFKKREIVKLNETEIPFINYDDLIADKEESARPKDIDDLEQLKNKRETNNE